jgi:hypothetical protein
VLSSSGPLLEEAPSNLCLLPGSSNSPLACASGPLYRLAHSRRVHFRVWYASPQVFSLPTNSEQPSGLHYHSQARQLTRYLYGPTVRVWRLFGLAPIGVSQASPLIRGRHRAKSAIRFLGAPSSQLQQSQHPNLRFADIELGLLRPSSRQMTLLPSRRLWPRTREASFKP